MTEVRALAEGAEAALQQVFLEIDRTAERGTGRVLTAFRRHLVSDVMFAGSTGYGYGDRGRDTLDAVWADVFGCERALVRIGFVGGTHAIGAALYAVCDPGKTLVSAMGAPYDTLRGVIGIEGNYHGSLRHYGVGYRQIETLPDGGPDLAALRSAAALPETGAVFIQRSRGYDGRRSLSVREIREMCAVIRAERPELPIVADNCYGEFVEDGEPGGPEGADLLAGSLIKNPGGGLAPTGGYIAGKKEYVERAACRMTVPGIGGECGASLGQNRALFQGLFMAPHTVAQALKTACLCAAMLKSLGYKVDPGPEEARRDIIQAVEFGNREDVVAFCEGIQSGAPVDAFVTPEPWPMPGYNCDVIMAAGAFIQGASIELSCDAPMREPYRAFLQGGLTYESGKLGVMRAVERLLEKRRT